MAGPPYQRTLRLGHLATLPPSNLSNSPSPHHFQFFLVGLKYITSKQTLEIIYEDHPRFFVIASIMAKGSSKLHSVDSLSRGIENLSLVTQLWSVSWDTKVLIIESDSQEELISKVECIWDYILYTAKLWIRLLYFQPGTEILSHQPKSHAYSSVGGLEKQISAIRDLLEIPLTRPELFHHFG